jgi:hypothetical protein
LNLYGEVTLKPDVQEALLEVYIRLEYANELIGESRLHRLHPNQYGSQVAFEIVTSLRLLRFITAGLSPTTTSFQINAEVLGHGKFSLKAMDAIGGGSRSGDDPQPGEWKEFELSQRHASVSIDRSEWYQSVLAPTKGEQYRFLEIALPRSDGELAREWAESIQNLQNAERSYATGDDAAVFNHLRGALDALPGANQNICNSIGNDRKRRATDDLVKQVGVYLHLGRHVSQSGSETGTFPVDHLDAAFAIDLMRTTLSHLSLILSAEAEGVKRNA